MANKRVIEREKKLKKRIQSDLEHQINEEKKKSKLTEIEVKKLKVQL